MQHWTTTPVTAALVRGALDLETTELGVLPHRLPGAARAQVPDEQLAMAQAQPSGVRLVFRTRATAIELDVVSTKVAYRGAPPRPDGVFDLVVDGELVDRASTSTGTVLTIDLSTGSREVSAGGVASVRFGGLSSDDKAVEIWLPHTEVTELVALRTDAPIEPADPDGRRVWVHHGSSISHGSNAASPSTTWPALAAARAGVELVNLGFGGSALLDPFTARAIRDTPADLVSVKLGINLVNTDLMRLRAFAPAVHGFLDTIREGHPTVPLLVIGAILCPIHEDTPGPAAIDPESLRSGQPRFIATGDAGDPTRLTLTRIRAELERIVAARSTTDPNLSYLDGRVLYGSEDTLRLPLPDALHPDAETHRLIGERFAAAAFLDGGAFSG